jgi:hypothetical protein
MTKIIIPTIPIEYIIEEISYILNPINLYDELVITNVSYSSNNILQISGRMQPEGTIIVFLDSGHSFSSEADLNGNWTIISDEAIDYTDEQFGIAYATFDGIQYDTVVFDVPAANDI